MEKDFLQGILNDIKGYATKTIPGAMGITSSQGKALLGMADITGGMLRQEMGDTASMDRARLGETSAMDRLKASEAGLGLRSAAGESGATMRTKLNDQGATDRQKMSDAGALARQTIASSAVRGGLSGAGLGKTGSTPGQPASGGAASPPLTGNWWDTYAPAPVDKPLAYSGEIPLGDDGPNVPLAFSGETPAGDDGSGYGNFE